jgi:Amidohydrolase family
LLAFALCIGQTPLSAPAKERIIRRLSSVSCLLSAIGMLAAMCASAETKSQLALGKERELGTIEPGKLADIAVVKGNPLFDIVALSNVDVVIKDGVPYRDSIRVDLGTRSTSR